MISVAILLAAQTASMPAFASQAADIASVASLLANIEQGAANLDGIRFEGLESNEALPPQDFLQFATECPLAQLNVVPAFPHRGPVFATWDCHDYRSDAPRKLSDNRQAVVFFAGAAIQLIKFGVPKVITVGGVKEKSETPHG